MTVARKAEQGMALGVCEHKQLDIERQKLDKESRCLMVKVTCKRCGDTWRLDLEA